MRLMIFFEITKCDLKGWSRWQTLYTFAHLEFITLDSIETPCSVKTKGRYLLPPFPIFEVAICDLKEIHSSCVNWNIKSDGNRSIFRFTALKIYFPRFFCAKALITAFIGSRVSGGKTDKSSNKSLNCKY